MIRQYLYENLVERIRFLIYHVDYIQQLFWDV